MAKGQDSAAAPTGAEAPTETPERWSAVRKTDVVLRLLKGEANRSALPRSAPRGGFAVAGRRRAAAYHSRLARSHEHRADEHVSRRHGDDAARRHAPLRGASSHSATDCNEGRKRRQTTATVCREAARKAQGIRGRPRSAADVVGFGARGSGFESLRPDHLQTVYSGQIADDAWSPGYSVWRRLSPFNSGNRLGCGSVLPSDVCHMYSQSGQYFESAPLVMR